MPDAELIALGKRELERLGLVSAGEVEDGTVVRMPKAYPVYDSAHRQALETLRRFFESFDNLQLVGRNGLHRYNNQDHSMDGDLAVRNILGERHDLWAVNQTRSIRRGRGAGQAHRRRPSVSPRRSPRARTRQGARRRVRGRERSRKRSDE